MAAKKPTTTEKHEEPGLSVDWPRAFKSWAEGRTGLTEKELIDFFAAIFKLTPAEQKTLEGTLPKPPPKTPTPEKITPPPAPPPKQPTVKPELVIARTPYPKWWKDTYAWPITIITAGTHVVIPQTPGYKTYIATIVFTVSGETNITFEMGPFGQSGAMDFGGENEPRGIVMAMGESPMPCGEKGFKIITDGTDVRVAGFIVYYYESTKET
jgi:hypothetical protein